MTAHAADVYAEAILAAVAGLRRFITDPDPDRALTACIELMHLECARLRHARPVAGTAGPDPYEAWEPGPGRLGRGGRNQLAGHPRRPACPPPPAAGPTSRPETVRTGAARRTRTGTGWPR